jgi:hypothetical protein
MTPPDSKQDENGIPWQASATLNEIHQREIAHKAALDMEYKAGWNSAIEMVAYRLEHDFQKSFGKDTLHSIAIWMKEMKK